MIIKIPIWGRYKMAEIRRYDDIMQQACANMIAKQDKITDFNAGSIIHTFLDTIARIAERIYVAIRQGYNENLRLVPYSFFGFERKSGSYASGTVQFERKIPLPARSIIPTGTKVSGKGKNYMTTAVGYIEPGSLYSNPIKVVANVAGTEFNIPAFTIDTIDSVVPSDIMLVANPEAITGGTEKETDDEFDERFKIHISGLSGTNTYAIMDAARSVDLVRSISVKNHKPPLMNIYNMSIYVDDGSGSASEETIEAVKLAIEGDGTVMHQGHLAPGINVRVLPPKTVPVNFSLVVYVYRVDMADAKENIKRIIVEYVNSLLIGKSVVIAQILSRITQLSYVRDVRILTPEENIAVGTDQIARYNNAEVELRDTANE
jgi:uncharacterized phage protein gp47/JayE